jgi:hypothetical protein
MVLNVVAFEPVDSLNIPINFALQKSKAEVNTISGCCTSDNIVAVCHRTCYSRFFINPGETMRDIGLLPITKIDPMVFLETAIFLHYYVNSIGLALALVTEIEPTPVVALYHLPLWSLYLQPQH